MLAVVELPVATLVLNDVYRELSRQRYGILPVRETLEQPRTEVVIRLIAYVGFCRASFFPASMFQ
jgi:hypothetical protein